MMEYLLRYTVGLYVEAPEDATHEELCELYREAFEEWLMHGNEIHSEYVEVEVL